jgi:hypothetical protein
MHDASSPQAAYHPPVADGIAGPPKTARRRAATGTAPPGRVVTVLPS